MSCNCEFTEYDKDDFEYGEESWHYLRTCLYCKKEWYALHCEHDGIQNPCPKCDKVPLIKAILL